MNLESVMSKPLQENLEEIKKIAKLHLDKVPCSGVDYSTKHSERIVHILERLLFKLMERQQTNDPTDLQPLNEHEVFVLLTAVYLHHIGIIKARESTIPLPTDEFDSYSLILDSVFDPDCPYRFGIPKQYVDEVAVVVQGLARSDISSTTFTSHFEGINTIIRVRLLSALLKIADSLDLTYQSINFHKILASNMDLATKAYWAKYYFVHGLGITQRKIEINFRFPKDRFDQYKQLIPKLVFADFARSSDGLKDILWNYEVYVELPTNLKNHKFLKRSVDELPENIKNALECIATGKPIEEISLNQDKIISDTTPSDNEFIYDVAISYAGIHREYAAKLAQSLKDKGLRVFFDRSQLAYLNGKNLLDKLLEIYRDETELCILLASNAYNMSSFTQHERQAAQDRALRDSGYIFLVKMDDVSEINGFFSTVAYIEWKDKGLGEILALILERLEDRKAKRLGTS